MATESNPIAGTDVEHARTAPHERPEDWGWHHDMGKWGRRALWIPILILISLNFGNHRGRVEDIWLTGLALGMVVILLWDARRRKNAWRSR